jgi:hypothetical protein
VIISEKVVAMVQEMVRLQVRDIRDRKLVQEQQDLVSKVVRCHCIEDFQREDLLVQALRKSLLLTYPLSMLLMMGQRYLLSRC